MTGAAATASATAATEATASVTVATEAIAATVAIVRAATAVRVTAATKLQRRRNNHGYVTARRGGAPGVLPPPQELPVLRRQCAEDRLQGRQASAAFRLGARQDRAEPHHRRVGEEAA